MRRPFALFLLLASIASGFLAGCGGSGTDAGPAGRRATVASGTTVSTPVAHRKPPDVTGRAAYVAPGIAWALTRADLSLTRDGGRRWRAITPPGVKARGIMAVLFTNPRHGYVATSTDAPSLHAPLDILRTTDGGRTWRRSTDTPRQATISGAALSFHGEDGWALVGEQGTMGSNAGGHLYATTDGGASWHPVTHIATPLADGSIEFVSGSEGFLEGGVGAQSLWRTDDGGRTWARVRLAAPLGYQGVFSPRYELPQILAGGSGLLAARFTKPSGRGAVGLYVRSGRAAGWRLADTLLYRGEAANPSLGSFTAAGPGRVEVELPGAKALDLVTAHRGRGGAIRLSIGKVRFTKLDGYEPISFADREHALAIGHSEYCPLDVDCSRRNDVYFSEDGGRSWRPSRSRP